MDTKNVNKYWSEAGFLIKLAAKFSQKKKLKENLLDEANAWKVKGAFQRYYHGNMAELDKSIKNVKNQFEWQVMVFNAGCKLYKISEIRDADKFLSLMEDVLRREFYKKAIKKAKEDQVIYRLQDIEEAFRQSKDKKSDKNTSK